MPVSKHRKKGQKKAVKRPGAARAKKVPVWQSQENAVVNQAMELLDVDDLDDDAFEAVELLLSLVLEETMAMSVAGDSFSPRIGSRTAVIEAFGEEMIDFQDAPDVELEDGEDEDDEDDQGQRTFRRMAAEMLNRFEQRGVVRFDDDQLILALPIPQYGAKAD